MKRTLVIIPTYNEGDNIHGIILETLKNTTEKNEFSILVIDDNSPDGTAVLVEKISNPRVFLIKREKKLGLGTAYILGFDYAIKNNYDYICEMDADFSHDPKQLKIFIEKIDQGYDLVIGSRYIKGGKVFNWPVYRLILSYLASLYTRVITGLGVMDTTAGFMCYRTSALRQINFKDIHSSGYSFQIEMKFRLFKKGFNIIETPIVFMDRRAGQSKMSKKIIWEACIVVWKLKFKALLGRI